MTKLRTTPSDLEVLENFVMLGIMPKSSIYEMIENAVNDVRDCQTEIMELRYAIKIYIDAIKSDNTERIISATEYLYDQGLL